MDKLSTYTGKTVFLKELMGYRDNDNPYDCRVKKDGECMKTQDAMKYIAFRKCVNMPTPNVYKDNIILEELDIQDIKPNFGDES